MLLAIDFGNTNTSFAVYDGENAARPLAHLPPSRSAPPTNTRCG